MATKKELRGEIARLTELNQKIRKKCLIAFHAMHEAQHEIARMKRQMEPRITMLDEFGKANFSIVDDERAPPEVLEVINKLIQTLTSKK